MLARVWGCALATMVAAAVLGACDCGASHGRSDGGAVADAATDGGDAGPGDPGPDGGALDAGPTGDLHRVLAARILPVDALSAHGLTLDGRWVTAAETVPLPGIPGHIAVSPEGGEVLITYVTSLDGERGVISARVEADPLRVVIAQTLVIPGAGRLPYVGFTGSDSALVVRYQTDVHQLVPLRRNLGGAWVAGEPLAFPVEWPGPPRAVPALPGEAVVPRQNARDLRDGTTLYAVDHTMDPPRIEAESTPIDGIGPLAVHPHAPIAYLLSGAGVPHDRHQTGLLHVVDRMSGGWAVRGAAFELPNRAALVAVAPDGTHAVILDPVVQIDRDPDTGDPIFTPLGYGIDRIDLDPTGAPTAVTEHVARFEADRVEALAILDDGRVLVARAIGSGPIEHALLAFRPDAAGALVLEGQLEVEGLLRVALAL